VTINVPPLNVNPPTIANQTFSVVDGSPHRHRLATVVAAIRMPAKR